MGIAEAALKKQLAVLKGFKDTAREREGAQDKINQRIKENVIDLVLRSLPLPSSVLEAFQYSQLLR